MRYAGTVSSRWGDTISLIGIGMGFTMSGNRTRSSSFTLVVISLVGIMMLFMGLALVAAQETDGRVNNGAHVGGAAVYCVDATFTPADNWSDGGIRVLDARGQELLFAPAADIKAEGDPPVEVIQVGSGANAYGTLELYYRPDSKFELHGTDEHGKAFVFEWGGCGYQAPVAEQPEVTPEPTCEPRQLPSGINLAAVADPCKPVETEEPECDFVEDTSLGVEVASSCA